MLKIDYFKKNLEKVEKFLLLHWFIPVMNVQMIKLEKISSIKEKKKRLNKKISKGSYIGIFAVLTVL